MVFWAWLEPEVGDGARLGADGHAHHVLHLVDAVALRAAPGQLGEPLALPDQDEPLWEVLQGQNSVDNKWMAEETTASFGMKGEVVTKSIWIIG